VCCVGVGWRQDNTNRANQESKFDFLATHQCLVKIDEGQQKIKIVQDNTNIYVYKYICLVKIDEGQQKIKIVCTNRQSNLRASCQSIFKI